MTSKVETKIDNDAKKCVLVFGMAFVTSSFSFSASYSVKKNTSNPYVRDRARLLSLASLGYNIITCNENIEEKSCEEGHHFQASFSRRAGRRYAEQFPIVLNYIFLDYFRFPGVYMRQAYRHLLTGMLIEMRKYGVINGETLIYVPSLPGLLNEIDNHQAVESIIGITADNYPLYVATDRVEQQELGNYTNLQEIEQLDKNNPFVILKFKSYE
jgi:hypothetical protein